MPDARDHRHRRRHDCARQDFFVERPEILQGAAAARDDDHVDGLDARHLADRMGHFASRAFALHARRRNHQVRIRIAPAQHPNHVAQRGAVDRRDQPDAPGQGGERPLARGIEQAFGRQSLLQLFERLLQRAESFRLHVLAEDLILALGVVHADLPARHDLEAVFRLELEIADRRAEHDRLDLRRAILEREVHVPGVPDPRVRNLALDPHVLQLVLEQIADRRVQLGHT